MIATYVNGPLKIDYRKGAVYGLAQDLTPYSDSNLLLRGLKNLIVCKSSDQSEPLEAVILNRPSFCLDTLKSSKV